MLPRPAAAAEIVRAWEAGHAVLPLDPASPAPELRWILDALRPTHLVDRDGLEALPGGEPVDDGVAAVVATSGTTGAPKGAELTAEGIQASALAVSAALGAAGGDRWLACVGLHSGAGLAIVARSWHGGLPVVVHDGHPLDGVELAIGGGGEITLRGPMVLRRYRRDPGATRPWLRGGWLHTADLGRIRPDGRLQVLGRRDDLVITGGVSVHPAEVEAVLARHPG